MAISSSTSGEGARLPQRAVAAAGNWRAEAWAVFVKDVRSELRTRAAVASILLFAFATLIVISLTARLQGQGLTLVPSLAGGTVSWMAAPEGSLARKQIVSALFWIILLFSAMAGLPRTFVKEEEMRTAAALRLAARPIAVFAGKLLFNALLVLLVVAVVVPLFLIILTPYFTSWPLFLAYVVFGALGMAGSATILGAIVARAGGKAYLMLPLAFPILLPILVFAINGTTTAMGGEGSNQLLPLVSYVVAMVTLSALLFGFVWSDV